MAFGNGAFGNGFFGLFGGGGKVEAPVDTDKLATNQEEKLLSKAVVVALDDAQDGSIILQGGANTFNFVGVENELLNVKQLVEEYQSMAQQPEIRKAVDIIVNDIVTCEEDETPVSINLEKVEGINDAVKEKITDAFKEVMQLLDFDNTAYQKIRKWYVEGRQAFHVIVDPKNKKAGIAKLVMMDTRCIRPVYIVQKEMRDGVEVIGGVKLQYYYNPNYNRNAFTGQSGTSQNFQPSQQELVFDEESIVYLDSGEDPLANGVVPGLLNPAIRPLNNLVTTEDATVIYAITRAPEKRAFYLDVGTLGKKSAEEYMQAMMGKFKNRLAYDRTTGKVAGNTHLMGIAEDYWLPRREGQNATEISNVGGGDQLGQMDHVNYFREKLYESLMIPKGRLQEEGSINIGGSNLAEITQEELRFNKFCASLRRRYSAGIFLELLRRQLILKNITDQTDWNEKIKPFVKFEFTSDSFIREQQENEILAQRMSALGQIEPYIGTIFSIDFAQRNLLRMSDEDIKDQQEKIAKEKKEGKYPEVQADESGGFGGGEVSPLKFRPNVIPATNPPGGEE